MNLCLEDGAGGAIGQITGTCRETQINTIPEEGALIPIRWFQVFLFTLVYLAFAGHIYQIYLNLKLHRFQTN